MLFLDKKTWQSIVELLSRVDLFDAIQGVGQVTFGKVGVEAHYTVKLKWSDKKYPLLRGQRSGRTDEH